MFYFFSQTQKTRHILGTFKQVRFSSPVVSDRRFHFSTKKQKNMEEYSKIVNWCGFVNDVRTSLKALTCPEQGRGNGRLVFQIASEW